MSAWEQIKGVFADGTDEADPFFYRCEDQKVILRWVREKSDFRYMELILNHPGVAVWLATDSQQQLAVLARFIAATVQRVGDSVALFTAHFEKATPAYSEMGPILMSYLETLARLRCSVLGEVLPASESQLFGNLTRQPIFSNYVAGLDLPHVAVGCYDTVTGGDYHVLVTFLESDMRRTLCAEVTDHVAFDRWRCTSGHVLGATVELGIHFIEKGMMHEEDMHRSDSLLRVLADAIDVTQSRLLGVARRVRIITPPTGIIAPPPGIVKP